MITTTFHVDCDGSSDDEDHDYYCPAEFEHVAAPGELGDTTSLHRQMEQRGWRTVAVNDGPTQAFCPLHPEAQAVLTRKENDRG